MEFEEVHENQQKNHDFLTITCICLIKRLNSNNDSTYIKSKFRELHGLEVHALRHVHFSIVFHINISRLPWLLRRFIVIEVTICTFITLA